MSPKLNNTSAKSLRYHKTWFRSITGCNKQHHTKKSLYLPKFANNLCLAKFLHKTNHNHISVPYISPKLCVHNCDNICLSHIMASSFAKMHTSSLFTEVESLIWLKFYPTSIWWQVCSFDEILVPILIYTYRLHKPEVGRIEWKLVKEN